MNNKLRTFMIGRYGIDELYKVLSIVYFILILVNIFIRSKIITILEILLIIIIFYRFLSKNIKQRRKENDLYLKIKNKVVSVFNYNKKKYKDRNTHMYKKCPNCGQKIRLPLKKGRHTVKCPKCNYKFEVKCHKNEKVKVEIVK
ncbi:MAG: hypothetical protein ACI310_02145 [Bacilli bacterium]